MNSHTQTQIARSFATLAVMLTAWFGAEKLAEMADMQLPILLQGAVTLGFGALTWLVSRSALNFAEDCLHVPPAIAPGLTSNNKLTGGTSQEAKPGGEKEEAAGKKEEETVSAADQKAERATRPDEPGSDTQTRKLLSTSKLEIETSEVADGDLQIVVTVTGLTNALFKKQGGLLQKLQRVPSVVWQRPKNLGDGRKQIAGVLPAGCDRSDALDRLRSIADNSKYQ